MSKRHTLKAGQTFTLCFKDGAVIRIPADTMPAQGIFTFLSTSESSTYDTPIIIAANADGKRVSICLRRNTYLLLHPEDRSLVPCNKPEEAFHV